MKTHYKPEEHRAYSSAFATLSSPNELSFYRREQRDLIRILSLKKSKREHTGVASEEVSLDTKQLLQGKGFEFELL